MAGIFVAPMPYRDVFFLCFLKSISQFFSDFPLFLMTQIEIHGWLHMEMESLVSKNQVMETGAKLFSCFTFLLWKGFSFFLEMSHVPVQTDLGDLNS